MCGFWLCVFKIRRNIRIKGLFLSVSSDCSRLVCDDKNDVMLTNHLIDRYGRLVVQCWSNEINNEQK